MSIAKYIKEIGRGKEGARSLSREQAKDLMGQILDQQVSDLEVGGFCLAMRIKGESAEEMAGFLDATHARMTLLETKQAAVVIPSYNGARKLPGLTTLLALLLAREGQKHGFEVFVHGCQTEDSRVSTEEVFLAVNGETQVSQGIVRSRQFENLAFVSTRQLHLGLKALLDVRRSVGLRNSAHSLVKLMNPTTHTHSLVLSSYTHPEYLQSMTATLALTGAHALLLRGTEGEAVADPRRMPKMDGFAGGVCTSLQEAQLGVLQQLPDLPSSHDAKTCAQYTLQVLEGDKPIPTPIARQVQCVLQMLAKV